MNLYNDRLSTLLRFPLGNCAMCVCREQRSESGKHM